MLKKPEKFISEVTAEQIPTDSQNQAKPQFEASLVLKALQEIKHIPSLILAALLRLLQALLILQPIALVLLLVVTV